MEVGCTVQSIASCRAIPNALQAEDPDRGYPIAQFDDTNPNISWVASGTLTFPVYNPCRYNSIYIKDNSTFQLYFPVIRNSA